MVRRKLEGLKRMVKENTNSQEGQALRLVWLRGKQVSKRSLLALNALDIDSSYRS